MAGFEHAGGERAAELERRTAGRLPEGRHRGSAGVTVYNDKFYLLCGNTLGHYTGHNTWFDEYDPQAVPTAPTSMGRVKSLFR